MTKSYDDVENFENKFSSELLFLLGQCRNSMHRITDPAKKRFEEIQKTWYPLKDEAEELLNDVIPLFNEKLWEAGIGAIRG